MASPLAGVRVLDLSALLPGPYATWLLQRLGAEVIKIERPRTGDPMRAVYPGVFTLLNAEKYSVAIDLKQPAGRTMLLDLGREADVLVEGFRPGVAERLGIGHEQMHELNPALIYCSISAYGRQSPFAGWPAHDLNVLAMSGVLSLSDVSAEGLRWPGGLQWGDLAAALFSALEIVAALLARHRGAGVPNAYLDLSLNDSVLQLALPRVTEYLAAGGPDPRSFFSRAAYGVFPARDGRRLSLACIEEPFWQRLRELLDLDEPWTGREKLQGRPVDAGTGPGSGRASGPGESAADAEAGWRVRNRYAGEVNAQIAERLRARDRDEWVAEMIAHDIPVAPVHTVEEVLHTPGLRERSLPPPLEARGATPLAAAEAARQPQRPRLGEHTLQVLGRIRTEGELAELLRAGVIEAAESLPREVEG